MQPLFWMYQVFNDLQNDDLQLYHCRLPPSFGWGRDFRITTTQSSCLSPERSLCHVLSSERDDRSTHP